MRRAAVCLLALCACAQEPPPTACTTVCDELVDSCEYAAFPTMESCLQGCGYWETEGADVDAYLTCVQDAECNTFAIVECEHEHGTDPAES